MSTAIHTPPPSASCCTHPEQPQWLCTAPAPGETGPDRYDLPGAKSVTIKAINHECAQAITSVHGIRLDGRLISTS